MKKNEKNFFDKYPIYDLLIVAGTAVLVLSLLMFLSVFTGVLTLGRVTVILFLVFLLAGSVALNVGRMIKKSTLEPEKLYEDYLTPAREARRAKTEPKEDNENIN